MQPLSGTKSSLFLKGGYISIYFTCILIFFMFSDGFSKEILQDQIHYVLDHDTINIESIIKSETADAITLDLLAIENGFIRSWMYHALHSKKVLSISSEQRANLLVSPVNPIQNISEIRSIIQDCLDEAQDLDRKYDKEVKGSLEASIEDIHGEGTLNYIFGGAMRGDRSTTCETSLPFCTDTYYSFAAGVNTGTAQPGPNYGCLGTTRPSPIWYHLKIQNPGDITIRMQGIKIDGGNLDIDFALWGPFSDPVAPCTSQLTAACTSCPSNTTNSSFYPSGNLHDCSFSAQSIENAHIVGGQTGQYFIMVITNYKNLPGTITFEKTAGNGTTDCSILPPPASNNSPVCIGQTINLTAASVNNATYNWTGPAGFSSNQQNPQITNAQPANSGIYSLTITVGSQTSEPTTTEVVVESMLPQGFLPQGPVSLCMDAPNTTYTTNTITGAVSYQWSINPSSAGTISGSGTSATVNWNATFQGMASIGVGAVNSCGSGPVSPLLEVNIMGPPPETGKPTGPNALCQGGQPTQYATSGSAGATSYEWMLQPAGAGNISGNSQTITVNWTAGFFGTAQLKVRAVNECGNSVWSPVLDILVSELPGVCNTPEGPILFCQSGESGAYSTSPVPGALSYDWSITPANAGTVVGSTQSVTVNWSSSFTGMAQLKVTAVNDCGQGIASQPLSVNILPNPQAFAGNDTTVFTGAVIVLKGSVTGGTSGLQFHWEPANLLVNPNMMRPTTIALTQSRVFTMTVTKTGTDCQYQDEVFIEVQGSPLTASVSATPAQICAGAFSQLHAQGYGGNSNNYQYSWYKDGVVFSNLQSPQVTPDVTTTYTVEVFDGVSTFTGTVTVMVRPLPLSNAGPDKQIDFNTSTTLSGSASPQGNFTWIWQPENKLVNATIQNPVTVPLVETTSFSLKVTDAQGCTSLPDQVVVSVIGGEMNAMSSATPPAVCKGASSVLSVQVSGGNAATYQYSWYQNGVLLGQNQTITVTPAQTTTYQVEVWDGFSSATSSVTVQVWPLPVASAGEDISIPNGTSTQLNGSATSGDGNYGFYWQPEDKVDNPEIADPTTVLLNASTNYTLTVTDGNGCLDNDQLTVMVTGGALYASITALPNEICFGQSSSLTALVSGGNDNSYAYTWSSIPAGFHSGLKDITVNPLVNTIYVLKVFDGFSTFTTQVSITVNQLPLANAGVDQIINNGMSTLLIATAASGAPPYSFLWSPAGMVLAPSMPATLTQNLFASQSFTVKVTDSKGCISDDQVQVSIIGGPLQVNPVADDSVICHTASTILRAIPGGGSNNYETFYWAGTDGFTSEEKNPSVSPSATTTYTVTVFDGFNPVTGSVVVKVNPLPEIDLIPDDPRFVVMNSQEIGACVYDTVVLDAGNLGSGYLWSNGSTNQQIVVCTSGLSFDVKTSKLTVTNLSTGCQSKDSLTVYFTFQNCSYGVNEPVRQPKLLVYPNPSRDGVFKVKPDESISWQQVEVYSMLGKRVFVKPFAAQKEGGNEFDLDLGHLPKGFYMLRLLCKQGVINQAIVISN